MPRDTRRDSTVTSSSSRNGEADESSRGKRGTYTRKACDQCRKGRTKCVTPSDTPDQQTTCERCARIGHDCTWNAEGMHRSLTRQLEQSLKNRIRVLEAQNQKLQTQLTTLKESKGQGAPGSPSTTHSSHSESGENLSDVEEKGEYDPGPSIGSDDNDMVPENFLEPTKNLFLENGTLNFYGVNALCRLRKAEVAKPPSDQTRPSSQSDGRHVLKVKRNSQITEETCKCTSSCWSKHLPKYEVVPLNREEHDHILDILFKFFTSHNFRIIPELFLRDMYRALHTPESEPPPRTTHYSPLLHNALLAVAVAFSDDPQVSKIDSRNAFAEKAKAYMDAAYERPSIAAVQAFSILSSFYASQGQQTIGFMYMGMSARLCQALGLRVDCRQWVFSGTITVQDLLDRNWCFHSSCLMDTMWALYVGREFGLSIKANDVQRLPPCVYDPVEIEEMVWDYPDSGLGPQPSFTLLTFQASIQLGLITREIIRFVNRLGGQSNLEEDEVTANEIDTHLASWRRRLPVQLELKPRTELPHKIMLHISYWWMFIILHRPFFQQNKASDSSKDGDFHVKRCLHAAEEIMKLTNTWKRLYTLRYVPVPFIQASYAAGTVFVLAAVQASSGSRDAPVARGKALKQVEDLVQALREVGQTWQLAENIADVFQGVLKDKEQDKSTPDRETETSEDVAMTDEGTESRSAPFNPTPRLAQGMNMRNVTPIEWLGVALRGNHRARNDTRQQLSSNVNPAPTPYTDNSQASDAQMPPQMDVPNNAESGVVVQNSAAHPPDASSPVDGSIPRLNNGRPRNQQQPQPPNVQDVWDYSNMLARNVENWVTRGMVDYEQLSSQPWTVLPTTPGLTIPMEVAHYNPSPTPSPSHTSAFPYLRLQDEPRMSYPGYHDQTMNPHVQPGNYTYYTPMN